jgi:hypothetical protein
LLVKKFVKVKVLNNITGVAVNRFIVIKLLCSTKSENARTKCMLK